MAMSITISINVEENQRFTPVESAVIEALQTGTVRSTSAADKQAVEAGLPVAEDIAEGEAVEAAPAPVAEPKKRAPRTRKAAPAPESADSTTPAVLDTTLDEAPAKEEAAEEVDPAEAQLQAMENAPVVTIEQAVSIATELIGNGGKAKVKAALETLQVGRVTELKDDAEGLSKFVELLQAGE